MKGTKEKEETHAKAGKVSVLQRFCQKGDCGEERTKKWSAFYEEPT